MIGCCEASWQRCFQLSECLARFPCFEELYERGKCFTLAKDFSNSKSLFKIINLDFLLQDYEDR